MTKKFGDVAQSVEERVEVDRQDLREALGSFATGVAIVTSVDESGMPVGLTVNSFSSVSMHPPLILFCIARDAFSLPTLLRASHFAVNILKAGRADLWRRFATRLADKRSGVRWVAGTAGIPLLPHCVAWLECSGHDVFEGGEHLIIVGDVTAVITHPDREAWLYKRGRYGRFAGDRD